MEFDVIITRNLKDFQKGQATGNDSCAVLKDHVEVTSCRKQPLRIIENNHEKKY